MQPVVQYIHDITTTESPYAFTNVMWAWFSYKKTVIFRFQKNQSNTTEAWWIYSHRCSVFPTHSPLSNFFVLFSTRPGYPLLFGKFHRSTTNFARKTLSISSVAAERQFNTGERYFKRPLSNNSAQQMFCTFYILQMCF